MEANVCDVNHLDADVLLPPRKRLLAGLKKQNSEIDSNVQASCITSSSSTSSSVFDIRLNSLLNTHTNKSDLSTEEIAEASSSAAEAAAKAAKVARAVAEEKAAIAAKAVAAAKSALDLVASFSEESGNNDRYLKRNKLKKQVPVYSLYKKQKFVENCKTDEELARNLHRVINSSPRTCKNPQGIDVKAVKSKKPRDSNADEVNSPKCNGHAISDEVDSEGTIDEANTSRIEQKTVKYINYCPSKLENHELGHSDAKFQDDGSPNGKKRGRVKLKKLPLSICTYKDKVNPKDDVDTASFPVSERDASNPVTQNSTSPQSVEPSDNGMIPFESAPIWKCQGFQGPACVKSNKVVQS